MLGLRVDLSHTMVILLRTRTAAPIFLRPISSPPRGGSLPTHCPGDGRVHYDRQCYNQHSSTCIFITLGPVFLYHLTFLKELFVCKELEGQKGEEGEL